MAIKKATTTDDMATKDSGPADTTDAAGFPEPVYGGPPATGDTPTRKVGDPVSDTANLTESGPEEPTEKPHEMESPWGSKITVAASDKDKFE